MSNLLEKASIITTPTAYSDGKLHSVKPVQTLGDELVTNGDFSTDSDWEKNQATISNGQANISSDGSYASIIQYDVSEVGKTYFYSIDIKSITGTLQLRLGSGTDVDITTVGVKTGYIVGNSTFLEIKRKAVEGAINVTIDNVSVKEVIDADFDFQRGSAATRVNSQGLIENVQTLSGNLVQNGDFSEIGSELVTNGSFDTDSDWNTEGTPSFSIANGVLNCFSDGAYAGISQNIVLEQGKTYKLEFDIVRIGENSGTLNFGDQTSYILLGFVSTNDDLGKKTIYFKPERTTTIIRIYRSSACDIDLDNVSVKEVGQNWEFGTGWSMRDGKAVSDGSANNSIKQVISFNPSVLKIKFDVSDLTQGSVRLFVNTPTFTQLINAGSNGSYETTVEVTSGANNIFFYSTNNFIGSIDNISVIEITDDTDLPRINYEGFSYQDSLGSELVTNGNFDTDSDWVKQTGWSIDTINGKAIAQNVPNFQRLQQNISGFTPVVGATYQYSFDISNVDGFYTVWAFGNTILNPVNTEGTITGTFEATSTNSGFYFAGATGVGLVSASIDNVSVKEYLGQEVVPDSGCGSLLLEPQSTNLLPYSEDFSDSSWIKLNTNVVADAAISPSGLINGYKVVSNSAQAEHNIRRTILPAATESMSIFAKKAEWKYLFYRLNLSGVWYNTIFDLEDGVVTLNESGSEYSIEDYGNGWYRCVLNIANRSHNLVQFGISENSYSHISQGDGTSGVYLWGAQLEEQSYATSYIPTNGSTATRLADVCNNAGSSDLINSTEGVLYAEISALDTTNVFEFGLFGDNISEQFRIRFQNGLIRGQLFDGAYQTNMSYTYDLSSNTKLAFKFKENDFALWLNGSEVATDNLGTTFSVGALNKLNLANISGTSSKLTANVKCLAVFKEALTNDELEGLTGEGYDTFNALALANNYTII